ncbi:MAG TPA: TIR domain-containing protein [Chthoniobacterales bacterium]
MAHAFISHSHRDADASAEILAALEARGLKCWTAPRDVPPGGSYAAAILTAIENASCFVLVYSEHANVSPHVLREVERALSLGINIIPVRFDSSSVSKSLDYLLATVHWLSVIAEPRGKSIDEVAERIASCVPDRDQPIVLRQPPPPAMAVPPPLPIPPKPPSTGSVWLLLGLILLALAGIIFAVQTVRHARPKETSVAATPSPTANPVIAAADIPAPSPVPAATPEQTFAPVPPPALAQETEPEMTVPPATPRRSFSRENPLAVVRGYFGYLSDRNTIKAYELLSTGYRSHETFVEYTRNFASTKTIRLISANETAARGQSATVNVTYDKQNQKFGWIRWRGPIQLVAERDGWRIESIKGLTPSSIRH